jgi:hypothetical protein
MIHTSLEHGNKCSPSHTVKTISKSLNWLLFDLDTNLTQFLDWVMHDLCMESHCYRLDPTLACVIWQCEVILQETVLETLSFYGTTLGADYKPRPLNFERSDLIVGLPSLDLLQLAVFHANHCLQAASSMLVSYLGKLGLD